MKKGNNNIIAIILIILSTVLAVKYPFILGLLVVISVIKIFGMVLNKNKKEK